MYGRLYILNGKNFYRYDVIIVFWLVVELILDSEVNFICVVVLDEVFFIIGLFYSSEEFGYGIFLYKLVDRSVIKRCMSEWGSFIRLVGLVGVV